MRDLAPYNPHDDATDRWSGWRIYLTDMHGLGELCDPKAQLVVIEPEPSAEHAVAHAVAHLDLEHHLTPGAFTDQECDDADDLALLRLDEFEFDGDAVPFDGPPTLIMKGLL